MTGRPLFQLSPRLEACARLVTEGAALADIGTDHAYLPVWLAKKGKIKSAIACDLREGPLNKATENIRKYQVEHLVFPRLSDGLAEVRPEEADTVVIAGMGGDVMIHILQQASWLKGDKTLILQCMTSAEELRRWLWGEGYMLQTEQAVCSEGRIYTVMQARWQKENLPEHDRLYPYIGLLEKEMGQEAKEYIDREIRHLENCLRGCRVRGEIQKAQELAQVVELLYKKNREDMV